MKRVSHNSFVIVLSLGAVLAGPAAFAQSKQQDKQSKGERTQTASLTGCVDEQGGRYVLLDEKSMNPIANLDADGVPTEALFAKHLGHKVTVRGSSTSGGARPVFKVRSIEMVSEMCATQTPQ